MKYQVSIFMSGLQMRRLEVDAPTHRKAAWFAKGGYMSAFEHIRVVGKTVRRYNRKLQLIKGDLQLFKSQKGSKKVIIALIGRYSEFYRFASGELRDKTFMEVNECIVSQFVGSVKQDPAPTDITALSAETSASKSILTSRKTLNGSAASVTILEKLTQFSIEKISGKSSAEDTVKVEWSRGSKVSPSKSSTTTLWATVKKLPGNHEVDYPGTNRHMVDMEGKTIALNPYKRNLYWGKEWLWKTEWLDFDKITASILPRREVHDNGEYNSDFGRIAGIPMLMTKCESSMSEPHWHGAGLCVPQSFLKIADTAEATVEATVKDIPGGTEGAGVIFVEDMKRYIGKTLKFKIDPSYPKIFLYGGWKFHKSFLQFKNKKDDTFIAKVIDKLPLGEESSDGVFCPSVMGEFQGKIMAFQTNKRGKVFAEGWFWSKEWLERVPKPDWKINPYFKAFKKDSTVYITGGS